MFPRVAGMGVQIHFGGKGMTRPGPAILESLVAVALRELPITAQQGQQAGLLPAMP